MFTNNWHDGKFAIGLVVGGIIAIFCLVWVIGLNYCPGQPCGHNSTPTDTPSYHEPYIPFGVGPNTTSGFEPEDHKGDDKYYERQDLRAQESVARATNSLVWLTFASSIIGFFGAGLLIWTLVETKKTNKIAREIGESQVRAYCSVVDFIKLVNIREFIEGDQIFSFKIKIHNYGQSPARKIRAFGELEAHGIYPSKVYKVCDFNFNFPECAPNDETINSQLVVNPFREICASGIKANQVIIIAKINLEYVDVFDKVHVVSPVRIVGALSGSGSLKAGSK